MYGIGISQCCQKSEFKPAVVAEIVVCFVPAEIVLVKVRFNLVCFGFMAYQPLLVI